MRVWIGLALLWVACASKAPAGGASHGAATRRPAASLGLRSQPALSTAPAHHTEASEAGPPPATTLRCPSIGQTLDTGRLRDPLLSEVSGIVASRTQPDVYWVHNDSGDEARVFALNGKGQLLSEVRLEGAEAQDWEDIAIGPGSASGDDLYVADVGDNSLRRSWIQLYRFAEPDVSGTSSPQRIAAEIIEVGFRDGPHDVETLLVDPATGDAFLVEKAPLFQPRAHVGVYRIAKAVLSAGRGQAERVALIPAGPATGGDIAADGSLVAVRSYYGLLLWPRPAGVSIAQLVSGAPCTLPVPDLGQQGEAFAFLADGGGYVTVAEGRGAALQLTRFMPDP